MRSSNVCWGVEIGAGSIRALKLQADGDRLTVVENVSIEHKKVLSTPGLDQDEAMRVALGQLCAEHDLTRETVVVSVPGHAAFARFAKLPPVEPKKVASIVQFEAKQQIPFPLEEVEWDYQTFVSPDSPEIEVGIFAIKREKITERLAMYEDVGLTPDIVTLSPVAVYNALAYDLEFTEQTPGTVIVDVGTTSTDLIIADAGRVWVRTFPIGGHHFTEALVEAFKLSYPKAEKLKREAEQDPNSRHVFQAMRGVFSDLAEDVKRSIQYYQSLHKDAKLTRLIGLGSTFQLPGIRRFLKQQLQMNVYRLEGFKRLEIGGSKNAEFQASSINLCTAYGLALQGLGLAALEANLVPIGVTRSVMWKRKVPWFGMAAGVAVLTTGAMFIRPFLDQQAVLANPPDPVIRETLTKAERLKAEARNALGEAPPDFTPANLMALLKGREVYARLAQDLGEMLAAADRFAAEQAGAAGAPPPPAPVFRLKSFETDYDGPGGAGAGEPSRPGVGRGRSDFQPDPMAAMAGAEGGGNPQITVRLTVQTDEPRAPELITNTIQRWLEQHAQRDGVPYVVLPPPPSAPYWERTDEEVGVEVAAAPTTEPGAGEQPGTIPAPGAARGTGPRPILYGAPQRGSRDTGRRGEGGVPGGEQPALPTDEDPANLAPLKAPEQALKPGQKRTTFDVTFVVEVRPPQAGGEGGGR